jgi:uncharacterized delta-60 repeat protein
MEQSSSRTWFGTLARQASCLALALLALAPAAAAEARPRPGALDPFFGAGGRVVRSSNLGGQPWASAATRLAGLPGGGTVMLANRQLYAFRADGSSDRGFGGGRVPIEGPAGYDLSLSGLAVDAKGGVLVAGTATQVLTPYSFSNPELAMVVRYTPRGELDRSFGTDGVVLTNFGLPPLQNFETLAVPEPTQSPTQVEVAGIGVDDSGRIDLTGSWVKRIGPCRASTGLRYREALVARLDRNGNPDFTFGNAGVVPLGNIAAIDPPVPARDGIYLSTPAGAEGPCTEPNYNRFVGHLAGDGRPDPGFGQSGWVRLPAAGWLEGSRPELEGSVLAIDHRGRALLFAESRVRRFLPSGQLDTSFGRGGVAKIAARGGELAIAGGGVDSRGRILLAGTFVPGQQPVAKTQRHRSFFLMRLTARGTVDRSFGRAGIATTRFGAASRAVASSFLIHGRDHAIVGGTLKSPLLGTEVGLALAQYRLGS